MDDLTMWAQRAVLLLAMGWCLWAVLTMLDDGMSNPFRRDADSITRHERAMRALDPKDDQR